jgi:SAM-dependent methyltransferase
LIKINLGCGAKPLPPPWVNCDIERSLPGLDYHFDFGVDDWPFNDGTVDEILASHCLEHSTGLLHVMVEAYRVMVPGGLFRITVPHPRSEFFIGDPTHVMPITHDTLAGFSREWCLHCQRQQMANSPFALRLGVDFLIARTDLFVNAYWQPLLLNEDMSPKDPAEFDYIVRSFNNVIDMTTFTLRRI